MIAAVAALLLSITLGACSVTSPTAIDPLPAPSASATAPASESTRPTEVTAVPCDDSVGFDCDFQDRFAAVTAYLAQRPGVVGVVVHDRLTGARWSNDSAGVYIWTASTIKLAIAVNLLQRNRSGEIELSDYDYEQMAYMLAESDNYATDYLWSTYGELPSEAYVDHGLPDLEATDDEVGVWGYELATTSAMADLVDFALAELSRDDRAWLVGQMRGVIDDQRWGVLGLDDDARAGAKNGWDAEETGWVVNSVGFVGPRQRYTVAIMNDLGVPVESLPTDDGPTAEPTGDTTDEPTDAPTRSDEPGASDAVHASDAPGFDDGVETVSMVAHLLFAGRF